MEALVAVRMFDLGFSKMPVASHGGLLFKLRLGGRLFLCIDRQHVGYEVRVLRVLDGDALGLVRAIGALPGSHVRLPFHALLPILVLGFADDSGLSEYLDFLWRVLPLVLCRRPEARVQRPNSTEYFVPKTPIGNFQIYFVPNCTVYSRRKKSFLGHLLPHHLDIPKV